MNYCYLCGGKLSVSNQQPWVCTECGQEFYKNQKPCAELAMFDDKGRVLLSKRAREPYKGKFDMPGGYIDGVESAEEAIVREIEEELGLLPGDYTMPQILLTYSVEYPGGKDIQQNLITLFVAQIKAGITPQAKDDVELVEWVLPSDISPENMSLAQIIPVILRAEEFIKKKGGISAR